MRYFILLYFLMTTTTGSALAGDASDMAPDQGVSKLVVRSVKGRVEAITFDGLRLVAQKDVESRIGLLSGELLGGNDLKAAQLQLQELLKRKGFYNATVKIEQFENADESYNIKITVDEGISCVISKVSIEDPMGFQSKNAFLKFKEKMFSVLNINEGKDRYDEDHLADQLRQLRDWLVEQDYILANTESIRLVFNGDYSSVELFVAVTYGDRVTFGYQGNVFFTKGELNEFITQARVAGLGKDYLGVIQRKITDEYRSHAYNNVKIEKKVIEQGSLKHVTYFIDEGVRTKINTLRFDGLSDRGLEAARKTFDANVSRYVQRGYFIESDVDKGVELVLEDLKSRGYLLSKLVAKSVQKISKQDSTHEYMDITIQLTEGEQTTVGKIDLKGNTYLSSEEVKKLLKVRENEIFNPFALDEGIQKLKASYVSDGYLDFKILTKDQDIVSFTSSSRTANVTFYISEGHRIIIDEIKLQGLEKTRRFVVEREYLFKPGDYWIGEKIFQTETALRKLGLFTEVRVRPEPSAKGLEYKNLLVDLREADPGVFEIGPGFRTDLGFRAFSRLSYSNIAGKNWIGSIGAEANARLGAEYRFIEYRLDTGFTEPRFLGSKYLYSAGISTSRQRYPPDFNAVTTQFATGFERKFFANIMTTKLFYKLERIKQFDVYINGRYSEVDNATLLIGSLNPALILDTRDSPFTTTTGQLSTLALEYADPHLSRQPLDSSLATGYAKWTAGTHWYFPVTKRIVWSNVVAGGFERSNIVDRSIPLIKLFRLGGWASLRGYREDSINVDDIAIKGSLTYLNLRTQVDFPLVGELHFSPFLDAGNLYVDVLRNSPFLRAGTGAGLRYMTPIGPVNLDYGFNLNPRKDDDLTRVHFSIGFI